VVTGSGRVGHGILEIMNLLGVIEVEPEQFTEREFTYPVYVHLKGHDLYEQKRKEITTATIFIIIPAVTEVSLEVIFVTPMY
jgi:hypothetical protein